MGDYCKFGSRDGTVECVRMRSTRIRTPDRTLLTVPNNEFSNMRLENYTNRDCMALNTTLQVRYETTPDPFRGVRTLSVSFIVSVSSKCSIQVSMNIWAGLDKVASSK
ncbi:mechanosensitive ion channel domain-containing protein [Orrella marina]|uniref:mechanosensitive ion channel domain-containing protein n=1 Tax=Orrella marina TaxID=2163011 RepID=UPI003899212C